jgi:hypothetical protein
MKGFVFFSWLSAVSRWHLNNEHLRQAFHFKVFIKFDEYLKNINFNKLFIIFILFYL